MYEDSSIELETFAPGSRVLCIASAGCTAFDLAARGDDVTAVDVNPAQIEYVRRRLDGGQRQLGSVDRGLDRLRRFGPILGWRRSELERFCNLERPTEQLAVWRRHLDTRRFRLALRVAFMPAWLRRWYAAPFLDVLPPRFDRVLRLRFERGFGLHSNSRNPHVASLFLGRPRETTPNPLTLAVADAAEFLEQCPAGSFDGFSLSNILDGAGEAYGLRLFAAVRRAAKPRAVSILRSFREPADEEERRRAAGERALIWGSVRVEQL
jgi:S-adenosylmethionine:diacylglycerol 3-amino-3-carboxypropyl transferase